MKALLALILAGIGSVAVADELAAQTGQVSVEPYHYAEDLDIARVISTSEIPNVCGVVPVQMTYEDSRNTQHTIEYLVMGNGCTN